MTKRKDSEEGMSTEEIMALRSGIAAFETKQFVRAYQLLFPLAEAGNLESQFRLAVMAQNGLGMVVNQKEAVRWMQTAAEQGFDLAQHGLGFMYMQGECVEQDDTNAVYWFRLAAEQGLTGAQATLGQLYEEGRGVEKDLEEAKRWYTKAGF
ncbi:tetratricopeptide repeat protein [Thiotrichales bacterium HSG14]|nr:tetratricopeptide repeat protein [Thiotrichales bacterium HSG14]